jgi:hypothetical protein
MPTNNYPNIGYINYGRDFNFFQKFSITATTFGGGSVDGYQPDTILTFPTQAVMFLNLGSGSTNVIEYSFNGTTVHGELNPTEPSAGMVFDNRVISLIWFRVQAGSTGPITVSVQAWGIR